MKAFKNSLLAVAAVMALACCGDKNDAAEREKAAQQAIQEGMQKEKSMMEGMAKGVEGMEKKMTEQKEQAKK